MSQPRAGTAVVYAGADGTWREGVLDHWEAGADAVDVAVIAGVVERADRAHPVSCGQVAQRATLGIRQVRVTHATRRACGAGQV